MKLARSGIAIIAISISSIAYAEKFKIAVIPDTQVFTQSGDWDEHFHAQTRWIASNYKSQNIAFVSQLGDVSNGDVKVLGITISKQSDQMRRGSECMDDIGSALGNAIPYSVSIGNHDYKTRGDKNSSTSSFRQYFGPSRYAGTSWYGGYHTVAGNADKTGLSSYQTFSAGGYEFLHLNLEYSPTSDVFAWAQQVINAHPGMRTVISTHSYLTDNSSGTGGSLNGDGNNIWANLINGNSQIFMILCGHEHEGPDGNDGEYAQVNYNAAGQPVYQMLSCYQDYSITSGGEAWMRLVEFDTTADKINMTTYNPETNRYQTDANSQFSYSFDLDSSRFAGVPEPASVAMLFVAVPMILRRRR